MQLELCSASYSRSRVKMYGKELSWILKVFPWCSYSMMILGGVILFPDFYSVLPWFNLSWWLISDRLAFDGEVMLKRCSHWIIFSLNTRFDSLSVGQWSVTNLASANFDKPPVKPKRNSSLLYTKTSESQALLVNLVFCLLQRPCVPPNDLCATMSQYIYITQVKH